MLVQIPGLLSADQVAHMRGVLAMLPPPALWAT
jgi:hypothetical protein